MKSTFVAVLAACVSMLITSGIVAFATAAPLRPDSGAESVSEAELDLYVSSLIDEQYRHVLSHAER